MFAALDMSFRGSPSAAATAAEQEHFKMSLPVPPVAERAHLRYAGTNDLVGDLVLCSFVHRLSHFKLSQISAVTLVSRSIALRVKRIDISHLSALMIV